MYVYFNEIEGKKTGKDTGFTARWLVAHKMR